MGIYYNPSQKKWNVSYEKTDYPTNLKTDHPESYTYTVKTQDRCDSRDVWGNCTAEDRYETKSTPLEDNIRINRLNREENQKNLTLNQQNTAKNKGYDTIVSTASTTQGGDYVSKRNAFYAVPLGLDAAGVPQAEIDAFKSKLVDEYKTFYRTEKLQQWDPSLGTKPQYGDFDPKYYKQTYPQVEKEWRAAVANDDIDITERYGENGYYLQHYTNQGKPAGFRGNSPEETKAATYYLEKKPTDFDLQQVRDLQLGVSAGNGVTELEDIISETIGKRIEPEIQKFGALQQDALKQTIAEMKKAKAKENMLSLMGNLGGFQEIMDINKELSKSVLGDSGVGGIMAFTAKDNPEESLENNLQKITGVRNNVTYNWQQWFDNELKKRYENDLELGYTTEEVEKTIKIDSEFARKFIDTYLTPRFNTARSMDEFAEYMNVSTEEQNPFQTQDMLNAINMVADLRAKQYLDAIKNTGDRYFDPNFYFNPRGNQAKATDYALQSKTVSDDWDAAKKGDPYWNQQAYRFGIDVNNKEAFARMHFEVKGQGSGYDGSEDILSTEKVTNYITNNILPSLNEEVLKQGTVFGQFITPEQFADEMLVGLDPNDKTTWENVLKNYGLTSFKGDLKELKTYIIETLRTGAAQDIRSQIKYLNERKQKPTQKVLGLTYIQRPEDYKTDRPTETTELYKIFQSSGYQGTEDEFYKTMFPDVDRSEQLLLTKAGSGSNLALNKLDFSDPFASLGTIQGFFDEDQELTSKTTTSKEEDDISSYFKIGFDSDEEDYKSSTGEKILGEFTSMFKGF